MGDTYGRVVEWSYIMAWVALRGTRQGDMRRPRAEGGKPPTQFARTPERDLYSEVQVYHWGVDSATTSSDREGGAKPNHPPWTQARDVGHCSTTWRTAEPREGAGEPPQVIVVMQEGVHHLLLINHVMCGNRCDEDWLYNTWKGVMWSVIWDDVF